MGSVHQGPVNRKGNEIEVARSDLTRALKRVVEAQAGPDATFTQLEVIRTVYELFTSLLDHQWPRQRVSGRAQSEDEPSLAELRRSGKADPEAMMNRELAAGLVRLADLLVDGK